MIQSNFKVVFSEEAELDLLDAVKHYNKIKKLLGARLKSEVKEFVFAIKKNPCFASVKYKNTRTVACKIFPYSIHYEIDLDQKTSRITAILHFSKKPFLNL